jgi:hypothetical protein
MSFIDAIKNLWTAEQTNWALIPLTPPVQPGSPKALPYGVVVNPHQAYVTVRMRSMAIPATRHGWNRFHAALYTEVSLTLKDGSSATIQSVLSPNFLHDLDPKRLQNVLQIDKTIFGPVPYIGTRIGFESGVFAVKHADLAAPFLGALTELATVAGVGLISAAKPFIEPIKNGIELLTGTHDATSLEIAMSRELRPPETGWYGLIRRPASNVTPSDYSVRASNFELLLKQQPMSGTPYLVFSIEAETERPDWAQIPELKAAYAEFAKAANDNKQNDAKAAVDLFARRAHFAPELLTVHADDLAAAIQAELKKLFPGGTTASKASPGGQSDDLSTLEVTFRRPH